MHGRVLIGKRCSCLCTGILLKSRRHSCCRQPNQTLQLFAMKSAAILVACFAAVALAWPVGQEEKALKLKEAEEFAAKDLSEFRAALAADLGYTLTTMTMDLHSRLADVKMRWGFQHDLPVAQLNLFLLGLNQPDKPLAELKAEALSKIALILGDKSQDLFYYQLEGARLWFEQRPLPQAYMNADKFEESARMVVYARDALQALGNGLEAAAEDIRNTVESDRHKFYETCAKAASLIADSDRKATFFTSRAADAIEDAIFI